MEPEVDNNMKKCITNALSPKRVSDPAYGKDWSIDWLKLRVMKSHDIELQPALSIPNLWYGKWSSILMKL